MHSYGDGRKAANNVQILGWIVIALGILVGLASIGVVVVGASGPSFAYLGLPILLPSLALILVGSCAILLAHVARAVFDRAQRDGT